MRKMTAPETFHKEISEGDPSSASPKSTKQMILFLGWAVLVWPALQTVLNAWVLTLLWRWFVMPQFGVAPLSLPIAAGLVTLFHFITRGYEAAAARASKEPKEKNNAEKLPWQEWVRRKFVPGAGWELARVFMTVSYGWIIHLFVRH